MTPRTRQTIRRSLVATLAVAIVAGSLAPAASAARPVDRNRDNIPDRWERAHGLSLLVKQTFRNQDSDELFNLFEHLARTSPRLADSDGDGTRDGLENPDGDTLANGEEQYLKLHPNKADSDGDGIEDGADDEDGDGVSNHDEFVAATDPLSACDGDDEVDAELAMEERMARNFRFVASWYPVADYFDGLVDSDCDAAESDGDDAEGSEAGDDEMAGPPPADRGAGEGP